MLLADVYVPAALGRDLDHHRASRAGAGMASRGPRRGENRHVPDAPGLSRGQPDAAARPPRPRSLRPAGFPERRPRPHQLRSGIAAGRRPPRRPHASGFRDDRPLPERIPRPRPRRIPAFLRRTGRRPPHPHRRRLRPPVPAATAGPNTCNTFPASGDCWKRSWPSPHWPPCGTGSTASSRAQARAPMFHSKASD